MKIDLTDRYLRNLNPPDEGRLEVSDNKRAGLRFRLSSKGKAMWMFEKRVKGGPKRKHTLGSWPAVSLADARNIALEIEAESSRGIDRVAIAQAKEIEDEATKASRSTVKVVIDLYDDLHLSQLRSGQERKRQLVAAFKAKLGLPVSSLSHKDFQHPIDEKVVAGRAVYANRIRAALVAFSNWAWMRGYLDENIGQRLAKPTKEQVRDRVLSLEEVQTIYRVAGVLGPLWGPLVRLLMLTGQRRSEIAGLKWTEVDLQSARITKPGSGTKNKKAHITHLSHAALAVLEGIGGSRSGFVFTTTGRTPVSGLSRVKRRLDGQLGEEFQPWRFHDFRTAMATALAEAGEPDSVGDRIQHHVASGSAPSAVARVYNQSELLVQRARALDRWGEMVTGQTGDVVRLAQSG